MSNVGGNVFSYKGRPNEIGQCWCLVDLLYFHFAPAGTSKRPSIDLIDRTCSIVAIIYTLGTLHYNTMGPRWSILYNML